MARPDRDRQRQRIQGYAETMRRQMTASEARLWDRLKAGYPSAAQPWAAQRQLGFYIVDFYCARQRLVVEVDGLYHASDRQRIRDAERDQWLVDAGNRVVRLTNEDVDKRLALALLTIRRAMRLKGVGKQEPAERD